MSRLFVAPIIGQSAASGAQVIDGSLKFNQSKVILLKHISIKTFSSSGNRQACNDMEWLGKTIRSRTFVWHYP